MNLIEQLGGYEKAKNHRDYLIDFGNEFNRPNKYEVDKINNALLQYRRQHNIFEVGDDVVFNRGNVDLWVFSGASEVKPYDVKVSNKIVRHILLSKIRHATDAEIKAGRRLPVIESDDCSDIRNHISPNTVVIDHAT